MISGVTPRANILVVDDQAVNIRAVYRIFSGAHEVFVATDGAQALEICRITPPDLILLDLVMPGMNGLELCEHIKGDPRTRDVPVIFVTADSDPEQENACWRAGAVDYVTKPINALTLRNRVSAHLTIKFLTDQLRGLAFADGLTGVPNRRQFDERLDAEWRRCGRARQMLSLALIDIDCFKRYNDRYGHLAGDDCLRAVAARLRATLKRPYDLLARYGGEEFACLLPETDEDGALTVASALEAAVRGLAIAHEASDAAAVVTISIGVTCLIPDVAAPPARLIELADKQLYRAKAGGRGRVAIEAREDAPLMRRPLRARSAG